MTTPERDKYDVVVVGAGNAALTAALSAQEAGAKVLVLEKAPQELRGGDTYFAGGNFRFPYNGVQDVQELIPDLSQAELDSLEIGRYTPDDFYNDFMQVTQGLADPELIEVVASESPLTIRWMTRQGIKWDLCTMVALRVGNHLCWPSGYMIVGAKGGGPGLSDMFFSLVQQKGVEILYETKATRLLIDSKGRVCGVTIKNSEGFTDIKSKAVIMACGGFQASPEMRTKYLGSPWDIARVRGTRYNTGDGLKMALDIGAQSVGHWSGCHATPIDAAAPNIAERTRTDETNRLSFHFGITVNVEGKRFVDEGEDFNINTYAKQGAAILKQPQNMGFQIFDSKVKNLLDARYARNSSITANSINELAAMLGTDEKTLEQTVKDFNSSIADTEFIPTIKDGKRTIDLLPCKSNWACPIDSPPFSAYPVTCGITFTYGGLKINREAQVLDTEDNVIPGLYAAGEIVGGIFYWNYPGGTGFTAGSVFGRIAGANASA